MKISIKNTPFFAFFCLLGLDNALQARTHAPQAATQPKAVGFVFADVLESDRLSMTSRLGWFNSIWNLSSALKAQHNMFDCLFSAFGHQRGTVKAYDPQTGEELPVPFAEWLLGKNSAQVLKEIKPALNSYNFPNGEKDRKFISDVLKIIFDETSMAGTFGLKGDMYKLAEKLATGPAHPRLIMVANCNDQMFYKLRDTNSSAQKVFQYFNNIYVSSNEKLLVEDPQLYQRIIDAHTYHPNEYVIITSNKHAIAAAKSVGMQTVYSPDNLYSAGKEYCKAAQLIKK
jgi:FMN phosphatase YigB (HAD superfamily)